MAAGVDLVVVNLHYKAQQLRDHLAKRRDIEIVYSDETDELLDTGGGVVKALPHFAGEPFFILNSDSIWVEGVTPALAMMQRAWDRHAMDGLLLLAAMTTAMGYEGRGDFKLASDGRLSRVPEHDLFALRLSRGADRPSPPVRRCAGRRLLHQPDVEPRHRQGRLFGIRLDGVWIHVGTPEARDEAERYLQRMAPA